ncbi:complex I subunit 5 family protein [Egicoccus sp. AB-alg6-2]|uniref:complex I subunit 5 family protein n=1 Tax=Egicoccus sp. AB-alg6-2 TaxID=3242692 RepID=UPI00359EB59D
MADGTGLLPLLLAIPLLGAALTRLPRVHGTRGVPDAIAVVAAAATAGVGAIVTWRSMQGPIVHHLGGWAPLDRLPVGIPLVADPIAAGFVTLTSLLIGVVFVHLAAAGARGGGLTHVLTGLLLAAANGFLLAGDLFTMFVFLELLGITVYAITAGKTDDPAALPAAMNMAVTSTIGAVLLLIGVALLHAHLGTPNLAAIAEVIDGRALGTGAGLAVGLLVTGLAVKAGLTPFHFAHADLHTATTVQHAGLFGAILLPLGIYGVARVNVVALGSGDASGPVAQLLVVGGAVTAVVGGVLSLCQNHLKRLLAFSSVSHLGVTAAGLGVTTSEATAAVGLYVLGHAPMKLGLLLTAALVLHRTGALQVGELSGRAREIPLATGLLAVGALALAGAPPSGLFAGKAALSEAAQASGQYPLIVVLSLSAVLTGAALMRHVVHLVTGWPVPADPAGRVAEADHEPHADRSPTLALLPLSLVAAGLLTGVLPGLPDGAAVAATWFHDQGAYVAAVLDDAVAPGRPHVEGIDVWKRRAVGNGVLATLAAAAGGVAVARWRGARPPGRLGAPVRALRGLHTAHMGDYTAWLSAGAAVTVAWMVLSGRGVG